MKYSSHRQNSGFSMIEVMISIVVLSLGLLGVLGIVVKSLQVSSSSEYRAVAAQQSGVMAEALRANPSMLASFVSPTSGAMPVADCAKTAGCSTSDWSTSEFGLWQKQLGDSLPGGRGYVCRDGASDSFASAAPGASGSDAAAWSCNGSGPFVVKVCWNESRVAIGGFSGGDMCIWTTI
jgi:type IV pilus assembly protein PilV